MKSLVKEIIAGNLVLKIIIMQENKKQLTIDISDLDEYQQRDIILKVTAYRLTNILSPVFERMAEIATDFVEAFKKALENPESKKILQEIAEQNDDKKEGSEEWLMNDFD